MGFLGVKGGASQVKKDSEQAADVDLSKIVEIFGAAGPDNKEMKRIEGELGALTHNIKADNAMSAFERASLKNNMFEDMERDINLVHAGKAKA